jgi:hypothetical protein
MEQTAGYSSSEPPMFGKSNSGKSGSALTQQKRWILFQTGDPPEVPGTG